MPCNALLLQFLESTDDGDSHCERSCHSSHASINCCSSIAAVKEREEREIPRIALPPVKKLDAFKLNSIPAFIVFYKRRCPAEECFRNEDASNNFSSRLDQETGESLDNTHASEAHQFRFIVTKSLWSQEERTVLAGLKDLVRMCSLTPGDNETDIDNETFLHELVLLGGHLGVLCAMQAFRRSMHIQMQGLHLLLMLGSSLNHRWLSVLGQLGAMGVAVQALLTFSTSQEEEEESSSSSPRSQTPDALYSRAYRLITLLLSTRENMERFVANSNDLGLSQLLSTLDREKYDSKTQRLIGRLLQRLSAWRDEEGEHVLAEMHDSITSFEGVWMTSTDTSIKSNVTQSTFEESETSNGDEADSLLPSSQKIHDELVGPVFTDSESAPAKKRVTFAPLTFEESECGGDDMSEISADDDNVHSFDSDIVETSFESSEADARRFVQAMVNELLSYEDPSEALRIIRQSFKTSREEYARLFLEVGGPLALTQCLADRLKFKNVQLRGYDVLHQLLKLDGFGDVLGDLGAVEIVAQGIQAHPSSETLARDGCHALFELMAKSQANIDRFIDVNGIQVVVRAMETHAVETSVAYRACQVLQQCTTNYKTSMLQNGVASALSRVIERNLKHDRTNAAARAVLNDLLSL
jgi:hypothetical protein